MVFDKWYLIKSISTVTNYNSCSCFVSGQEMPFSVMQGDSVNKRSK